MAKAKSYVVAVLSDQSLFRQGLVELLHNKGFEHVVEYTSSRSLLAAAHCRALAVLMIDLDHQQEDTATLVRLLRNELPKTHLVLIGTALRQEAVGPARTDGVLETPDADTDALASAAAFARYIRSAEALRQQRLWRYVTPRQRDVMRWLATGHDNQTIARKLRIGERAVKAHLSMLLETFGVKNRTQLALIADHAGLRPPRAARPLIIGRERLGPP